MFIHIRAIFLSKLKLWVVSGFPFLPLNFFSYAYTLGGEDVCIYTYSFSKLFLSIIKWQALDWALGVYHFKKNEVTVFISIGYNWILKQRVQFWRTYLLSWAAELPTAYFPDRICSGTECDCVVNCVSICKINITWWTSVS